MTQLKTDAFYNLIYIKWNGLNNPLDGIERVQIQKW